MRPTKAVINLANLRFNYLNLKKKAKNRPVMAVVKAEAYGHGMLDVVRALESLNDKKPLYYGVALLEEAIKLRKSALTQSKILTFSPLHSDELDFYLKYDVIPTFVSEENLKVLKAYKGSKPLKIHVNIDTGMGRLGIDYRNAASIIQKIADMENVLIDGLYTHFATSDEKNKSFALIQLGRFNEVLAELKLKKINTGIVHAANSGAVLDLPEAYFDMIRPGISLYGYYPSLETSESVRLKPVMKVLSEISTLKKVRKGESVSYGRIYIAKKDIIVATVPIGYADGYNRLLSNKAFAFVKGKRIRQIGRVTMDRILFDVTDLNVKVGDKVLLMGRENKANVDAWEWSKILDTIPYEITCNISQRVPRVYVD